MGQILVRTMITPVTQPIKVETMIATKKVGAQCQPNEVNMTAEITVTRETIEPMARFRPPEIMQIIMPRDMMPVMALWRKMVINVLVFRKVVGRAMPKIAMRMIKTISTECFLKNAPTLFMVRSPL